MSILSRRPPPGETAAPVEPDDSSRFDVYALLGVTEDVSPSLAREVYWLRVEALREAQERGEREAQGTIEELNAALAILLDEGRRARYDRRYRRSSDATAPANEGGRRRRVGAALVLVLLTVAGALGAALEGSPFVLAGVVTAGMLGMIAVAAWPRRARPGSTSPFAVLRLTPDAGMREVNLAYQTIGQDLLSRVKTDPNAIARLERLDRAHGAALRMIASRGTDGEAQPRRHQARWPLVRAIGRGLVVGVGFILGGLGALVLGLSRWFARAGVRGARAVAPRLHLDSLRTARLWASDADDEEEEELLEVSIDLSRRLATGARAIAPRLSLEALRQVKIWDDAEEEEDEEALPEVSIDLGRRVSLGQRPGPEPAPATPVPAEGAADAAGASGREARRDERIEAYLVLDAIAGRRRVPIPTAPLRIGSGPDCDLVLSAEMGIAHEHAHVWQRDGTLLIHVIAQRVGACLVNDRPMTWASLEDGDVILLGDSRFTVEVPASD